jgi:hypothetical protein
LRSDHRVRAVHGAALPEQLDRFIAEDQPPVEYVRRAMAAVALKALRPKDRGDDVIGL